MPFTLTVKLILSILGIKGFGSFKDIRNCGSSHFVNNIEYMLPLNNKKHPIRNGRGAQI